MLSALIATTDRPLRMARTATSLVRDRRERPAAEQREDGTGQGTHAAAVPSAVSFTEARTEGPAPVEVAYERQGSGEPLLLLYGLGHHREAWERIVPLLAERYETIAIDLPGFGQSPDLAPAVPRDLRTVAA